MTTGSPFIRNSRIAWIIINVIAVFVWVFQLTQVGFPGEIALMNHTDSPQYAAVGDWLFGGPYTEFVATRTYLFPLFFTVIKNIFGLQSFFIVQSFLWLGSINF